MFNAGFCLAVHMNKLNPSGTPRSENCDGNLQGEDINEQILRHANSAAAVLTHVQSRHSPQVTLTKGVVGVVAKLGKVHDENLSQLVPPPFL